MVKRIAKPNKSKHAGQDAIEHFYDNLEVAVRGY